MTGARRETEEPPASSGHSGRIHLIGEINKLRAIGIPGVKWSINKGRVQWKFEGHMVHLRLCGGGSLIKWTFP